MIYFDSTYIARLYLTEHGSAEVRDLAARRGRIMCSELGQAEVASVIHRKLRESAITSDLFVAARRHFERELDDFEWMPVTSGLIAEVRRMFSMLPATVFLRAADAMHLTCAREAGLDEVYSNDRHFLAAAAHFGLRGVNVIPPR